MNDSVPLAASVRDCAQLSNVGLQLLDLLLLFANLLLLFFEGVDEDGGELIVLDAFDIAFRVAKRQQRLDLFHFLSAESDVFLPILFPSE